MDEVPEALEAPSRVDNDIAYLRQQLPQKDFQSERRIMSPSRRADDVLADSGFLDELLLAIRRKLLSFPEDESGDEMEEGQDLRSDEMYDVDARRREKRDDVDARRSDKRYDVDASRRDKAYDVDARRRDKRYDIDARPEEFSFSDEWNEFDNKGPYDPDPSEGSDSDGSWPKSATRHHHHHIRHSRRKSHHRRYKTTTPGGVFQAVERQEVIGAPAKLAFHPKAVDQETSHDAVDEKPSNGNSVIGVNRVNSQFDNLTNVIIMGNITHIKSPHDIIEDDNLMAAEIREALLLAVPLSLLLTVILLICVAFCCCRYRNHPAYREHMAYAYREDEDYGQECPSVSTGMCDFCLPDISYQAHLATKIKKSKKRRASDQIELVLGSDTTDPDLRDEGLKCHPPLYTLLSNLPPGSSFLEEDFRSASSFDSFRPSLPRRSQSLEYLTV